MSYTKPSTSTEDGANTKEEPKCIIVTPMKEAGSSANTILASISDRKQIENEMKGQRSSSSRDPYFSHPSPPPKPAYVRSSSTPMSRLYSSRYQSTPLAPLRSTPPPQHPSIRALRDLEESLSRAGFFDDFNSSGIGEGFDEVSFAEELMMMEAIRLSLQEQESKTDAQAPSLPEPEPEPVQEPEQEPELLHTEQEPDPFHVEPAAPSTPARSSSQSLLDKIELALSTPPPGQQRDSRVLQSTEAAADHASAPDSVSSAFGDKNDCSSAAPADVEPADATDQPMEVAAAPATDDDSCQQSDGDSLLLAHSLSPPRDGNAEEPVDAK